jgi:hypothetical protein
MKEKKLLILLVAVLVFIGTAAFVNEVFNNIIYVPLVMQPKWTASPTPTKKPTATLRPRYNLTIVKVENIKSGDPLDEYISIRNNTSVAVNLADWFIKDDGPNRYDFPEYYSIPKGATIKVWTKDGIDETYNLFWDSPEEVWNDSEDCAYLRDDSTGQKILVDTYCYKVDDEGQVILFQAP